MPTEMPSTSAVSRLGEVLVVAQHDHRALPCGGSAGRGRPEREPVRRSGRASAGRVRGTVRSSRPPGGAPPAGDVLVDQDPAHVGVAGSSAIPFHAPTALTRRVCTRSSASWWWPVSRYAVRSSARARGDVRVERVRRRARRLLTSRPSATSASSAAPAPSAATAWGPGTSGRGGAARPGARSRGRRRRPGRG